MPPREPCRGCSRVRRFNYLSVGGVGRLAVPPTEDVSAHKAASASSLNDTDDLENAAVSRRPTRTRRSIPVYGRICRSRDENELLQRASDDRRTPPVHPDAPTRPVLQLSIKLSMQDEERRGLRCGRGATAVETKLLTPPVNDVAGCSASAGGQRRHGMRMCASVDWLSRALGKVVEPSPGQLDKESQPDMDRMQLYQKKSQDRSGVTAAGVNGDAAASMRDSDQHEIKQDLVR